MAIVHAIQEIKVLCKRRHTNQRAAKAKSVVSVNILGTRLLSSPHWSKELRLPSLFVTVVDIHSVLAVPLANPRVLNSPTTKIKTVKISETHILPVSRNNHTLLLTSLVFFHSLNIAFTNKNQSA